MDRFFCFLVFLFQDYFILGIFFFDPSKLKIKLNCLLQNELRPTHNKEKHVNKTNTFIALPII